MIYSGDVMNKRLVSRCVQFSFSMFALLAMLALSPAHAQNTTAALRVVATDASGAAAGGVPVTIRHIPTGRSKNMSTNSDGIVTASGLAVGGPYEVAVSGGTYAADVTRGIYLELDKTEVVPLIVRPIIEEVVVTATATTGKVAVGVGTSFDRTMIDTTPAISRDFVSTLAKDPKIVVDTSVARGPAVSMAGQNFRFNSVTIDGVPQNDNFGLSKNASATQRAPISIDAIEAITVNLAPYDVSYGNFIGGNINIVTRSGTNEFHGSASYYSTGDSLAGNSTNGKDVELGDFSEDVYGFTLGGPIVRDKLFFFVNYEKFETTRPANASTIEAIPGVTQDDVDNVIDILNTEYGYDPGVFAATDDDEDEKILVKLDWNINDDHRATATYQIAEGDVIFDDFPTLAALHSNRYNINEKMTAYSLNLISNWTDRFSTEIKLGKKDVENRQISVDSSSNEFIITTPGGGTIQAGGDRFRMTNELDNESDIFRIQGDYVFDNHVITAGWERESKTVRNLFTPGNRGAWFFSSIQNLEDRELAGGFLLYGNANNGQDAEANFTLDVDSLFIQDEWTPTADLTLTLGVRFDTLSNSDAITDNPSFLERRGYSNGENLDGKDLVLPRFGFSYDATDRLTLRGGAGLFGGGSPLIILSNSYAGDGISRTFLGFYADFFGDFIDGLLDQALAELPDPGATSKYFQPLTNTTDTAQTDAISPDYDILSTWKYSLGLDYEFGNDWLLSADVIVSNVNNGYSIFEARRSVVGQAPDGRPIYDLPVDADYITSNTSTGGSTIITMNASKVFDTSWGFFDTTLGYTHQDVDEELSYNRFVTFETLAMDPSTDLNNPGEAVSRYEVEHRWTGTVTWQKDLFGENMTTLALFWQGRSGSHYSHVFGSNNTPTFGGNFLADFGSEGDNPGSQLFYVPTGVSDPIITGDPDFLADLDEFISGDSCLNKSRGGVVERNDCESDWINVVSLRFVQEVKLGSTTFDFLFNIENFGNLLNSDWGRVDSYLAPSNVAPANVAINGAGTQYILTPTASYDAGSGRVVSDPTISAQSSVYRIQLGVRFRF
jgi:hypothetical protein